MDGKVDDTLFHTFHKGRFTKIDIPLTAGETYTFRIKGNGKFINVVSVGPSKGKGITDKGYFSGVVEDVNIDEEGEFIQLGKTIVRNVDNAQDINNLKSLAGQEITVRCRLLSIERNPIETYVDSEGTERRRRRSIITLY